MSELIKELGPDAFNAQIARGVTLVDFWAPWCGPCRMQAPILETIAASLAGKAAIAKVNVDDHPALAAQFGIRGIPTLILFKDGQVVRELVGLQREAGLKSAIEAVVG